jgi:hypothetical protein
MATVYLILFILSAVCFLAAAANVASTRVNLVAAGLFCWVLVSLIVQAKHL